MACFCFVRNHPSVARVSGVCFDNFFCCPGNKRKTKGSKRTWKEGLPLHLGVHLTNDSTALQLKASGRSTLNSTENGLSAFGFSILEAQASQQKTEPKY